MFVEPLLDVVSPSFIWYTEFKFKISTFCGVLADKIKSMKTVSDL